MNGFNIFSYRINEVEVPAPTSSGQVRKLLQIELEGEGFPQVRTETPFSISIGGQTLKDLIVFPEGTKASALIEAMPNEGDAIALHFSTALDVLEGEESGPLVVGHFDTSKLEGGTA
jgi:hypothetical protein